MNLLRCFLVVACVTVVGALASAQTPAAKPAAKKALAPVSGVSFGASIGVPLMVSASDYFYNYADYSPAGLGLRWGIAGALRMRIAGIDKGNAGFAVIADARYTTLWHNTTATPPLNISSNARFGMLSFGVGLEQAFGSGRMQPFFGLTVDVNAIEPGTVRATTLDSTGYHTVTTNLAGDVWQLRFGVTPRLGIRTMLTRSLSLDVTAAYQIANIINRADLTPKNYLLDEHGREALLSNASLSIGFMWTMPAMTSSKKK